MSALIRLQCHLCKATFAAEAIYVCDRCLGPLEPTYAKDRVLPDREDIARRAPLKPSRSTSHVTVPSRNASSRPSERGDA